MSIKQDNNPAPIEVFTAYSHRDEKLRNKLESHISLLKQQGVVTAWHDRKIVAGKDWDKEIDAHLNSARVILLLISADFLASDYCYGVEMKRALERHAAGTATVIPVILRDVDWKHAPLSTLQALPKDGKPVNTWPSQDAGFADVARGIRKAIEDLASQSRTVNKPAAPTIQQRTNAHTESEYDVALSYATEDRQFVERVAEILNANQVRVFFDRDEREQVQLWGKDLGDELDAIYRLRSRHVVMFISEPYAQKMWTNHERKSALARAIEVGDEYVLPARFDKTVLPGLRPTVGYIDLTIETPESFSQKIMRKIGATRNLEVRVNGAELPTLSLDHPLKLTEVGGYVILGIEDEMVASLWRPFGEEMRLVNASEPGAVYEDVHFTNLAEMNEVFSALNEAIAEAERGKVSGTDPQKALEHALFEAGISRASRYIFGNEPANIEASNIPGLQYVIWGIRSDWAPIFKLLRPREHIEGPKRLTRNAHEVYFKDLSVIQKIPAIFQEASERSGGNNQEFLRLLFEGALRLRTQRSTEQTAPSQTAHQSPLQTYLAEQASLREKLELSISDIEKIIGTKLPIMAFHSRSWWFNDARKTQALQWFDAGWCVERVNLSGGNVAFEKMKPGGRASVDFFNAILDDLRTNVTFDIRDVTPVGRSWLNLCYVRCGDVFTASLALTFERDDGFGIEWRLYSDESRKDYTFQRLLEQKSEIESELSEELNWKREIIGQQNTWRISLYCRDMMSGNEQLRAWAVERVDKLYKAFARRFCEAQLDVQIEKGIQAYQAGDVVDHADVAAMFHSSGNTSVESSASDLDS